MPEGSPVLEVSDLTFVPVSALHGDNVVELSEQSPWYGGPALLHHLEHVHIASDRNLRDPRLPVQWVVRPGTDAYRDYRGYAGQLAGGVWRPGDEVLVLPSGAVSRIAAIETLDGPLEEAYPPMSVTVRLQDALDVSRGDVICRPHNRPDGREPSRASRAPSGRGGRSRSRCSPFHPASRSASSGTPFPTGCAVSASTCASSASFRSRRCRGRSRSSGRR